MRLARHSGGATDPCQNVFEFGSHINRKVGNDHVDNENDKLKYYEYRACSSRARQARDVFVDVLPYPRNEQSYYGSHVR